MGLIISTLRTFLRYIATSLPAWLRCHLLSLSNPSINAVSVRSQIYSGFEEQLYFLELGIGLLNMANARAWVRQVSQNQSIDHAIMQVVNLICYTFDWQYAEIWATHPTEIYSIYLQEYYIRSSLHTDSSALDFERAMRDLGFSTKNNGPFTLIWEIAGVSYVTEMPVWAGAKDIAAFSTAERKRLISQAGFKNCLAVPVVKNGASTHCLCFFRKEDRRRDKDLMLLVQGMLDEIVNGPLLIEDDAEDNASVVSLVSEA